MEVVEVMNGTTCHEKWQVVLGEGDSARTMSLHYGDVGSPRLHPRCRCVARPENVSLG